MLILNVFAYTVASSISLARVIAVALVESRQNFSGNRTTVRDGKNLLRGSGVVPFRGMRARTSSMHGQGLNSRVFKEQNASEIDPYRIIMRSDTSRG